MWPSGRGDGAGGEREQQHRQRVVRLSAEREVGDDGADDRPAERSQRAIADQRYDSGDGDRERHRGERDQVDDVLRPCLVAAAWWRVEEPVHARPAVAGLPDEVRDEQRGRDHDGQWKAPGAQDVAAPDQERRDQKDDDNGERVLRFQSDTDGDSEQRPRAAPEREAQCEPEHDHRRQLVERDRLEEQIGPEHPRHKTDHHRGERLRATRRPELAGDEGADQHRPRGCQDRERAQADQRPAEQLPRQRREQRRHRRELDIPALQMPPGNRVVQLVAMPPVPPGDGELKRALQRDDDKDGPGSESRPPTSLRAVAPPPPRLEPP